MAILGFVIKFLDATLNERNLEITSNPVNGFRISIRDRASLGHIDATQSAVPIGNTVNLYNSSATSDITLTGLNVEGNTDARFVLMVDSNVVCRGRIDIFNKSNYIKLPALKYISAGDQILLTIENKGDISGDFSAVIYYNE